MHRGEKGKVTKKAALGFEKALICLFERYSHRRKRH